MDEMLMFATVVGRKPEERTQLDEQKDSFDFGIRRLVVLRKR